MTTQEIMAQLARYGSAQTKKVLTRHGAKEPFFGVKVADMKKIQKKVGEDHKLSLELFATGNSDAMYLAGMIAEPEKMSLNDLKKWANAANWYMLSDYAVASVAAESRYGVKLGLQWIKSKKEFVASAGWATLANVASIRPDDELDIKMFDRLLSHVAGEIHASPNRVRYSMNGFVIAVGYYLTPLTDKTIRVAEKIGKVSVDMGETSCNVPYAPEYIAKGKKMGKLGKKRKSARC